MAKLKPVDHDPFAQQAGPKLVPVEHDPFAAAQSYEPSGFTDILARATPMAPAKMVWDIFQNPKGELDRTNDFLRSGIDGASFGFMDKGAAGLDALLGRGDYASNLEAERAKTKSARERLGGFDAFASEAGGGILTGNGALKAGATLSRLPKMGGILGLTADGAAMGGLNAAGHDESITKGALVGGAGGLAAGGIAKAASSTSDLVRNLLTKKPVTPDLDALKAAKDAAYKSVDDAGVVYEPDKVDTLVQGISDDMSAAKLNPLRHPMASSMLDEIKGYAGKPLGMTELDQLRQVVNRDVAYRPDAAEGFFGKRMVDNIDEFVDSNAGGELITTARDANRKYRNVSDVMGQLTKAERRAASTGTGGNADNTLRQNIRAILDNPRRSRFFDPKAKELMDKIVMGDESTNALRSLGRLSPETGGLQAALSTGASMANPWFALPAVAGFASKRFADRQTKQGVKDLVHYLSTGKEMPKAKKVSKETTDMLARILLGGGVGVSQ